MLPAPLLLITIAYAAYDIGVEVPAWLFSNETPGAPDLTDCSLYISSIVTLILLTFAATIIDQEGRHFSQAIVALVSVALGVSVISAAMVGLDLYSADASLRRMVPQLPSALPTALQAIALANALLAWRGRFGWPDLLHLETPKVQVMRQVLPFVLIIPAFTELLEITLRTSGIISEIGIIAVAAAINIIAFATLLFWAMGRISDETGTLTEFTHAMASAPIMLTSITGEIRHWSRGCEELYGWSAAEMVGRPKYDALRAIDVATSFPLRRLDDVRHGDRELIEQRLDGTTVHVLERVRLVEAKGRAPVLVHSMTDISARVRAEAALKETEANLDLALEAHRIGAYDWDVTTGKTLFSTGAWNETGRRKGQIGDFELWFQGVLPADRVKFLNTFASAGAAQKQRCSYHYRYTLADGSIRAVEGSARCLYDDAGVLVRAVGVNLDVTERDARDAALKAQQEQLLSVLQTVPSAMVIVDGRGIIQAFSASAERMFGYTAAEAIGLNVKILTPESIRHKHDSFIARYLTTKEKNVIGSSRIFSAQRRDGSLVPIELWLGEVSDGENHLFTAFCNDLSDRYAADERLADMRKELLHVSRLSALGEMAAGLAHELNQPLAATVYFLGAADLLLAEDGNRERGHAFVRMASEQTLRAGEIIRRMRDFITKEDVELRSEPIAGIIDDAVSLTFFGAGHFDVRIVYELDPAAEFVLADRVQIQQVFVNLLRNATEELRKFPPERRRITIATTLIDLETIEVSVADSGPGIDPAILNRLYMPFVSSKGQKGMGVGLSISRRIIEAHQGTFSGANLDTGGAIFRFTLPSMNLANEVFG